MNHDLILVGGGLANGLIAIRLAMLRPNLRVAIVEAGERLGGNHTWSSFDADMSEAQRNWTSRLYAKHWPGYSVAFPEYRRALTTGYASATGEMLDLAVRGVVPEERLHLGTRVEHVGRHEVVLADGMELAAKAVIDGRGYAPSAHLDLRWQKFLGQEVELASPHRLTTPIVMDARVPQEDGYRFVYVLPFGPRKLLIEDTYYSDGAILDRKALRRRIGTYAEAHGWSIERVVREEEGVLPIALGGDIKAFWNDGPAGVPRVGLRAALFHPTTGYSFPDAVRVADWVASRKVFDGEILHRELRAYSMQRWRERGFYRMLNRMLFLAAEPDARYRILQRFYGLEEGLIGRFYAAHTTVADMARILIGKPPVPVRRALAVLKGQA